MQFKFTVSEDALRKAFEIAEEFLGGRNLSFQLIEGVLQRDFELALEAATGGIGDTAPRDTFLEAVESARQTAPLNAGHLGSPTAFEAEFVVIDEVCLQVHAQLAEKYGVLVSEALLEAVLRLDIWIASRLAVDAGEAAEVVDLWLSSVMYAMVRMWDGGSPFRSLKEEAETRQVFLDAVAANQVDGARLVPKTGLTKML